MRHQRQWDRTASPNGDGSAVHAKGLSPVELACRFIFRKSTIELRLTDCMHNAPCAKHVAWSITPSADSCYISKTVGVVVMFWLLWGRRLDRYPNDGRGTLGCDGLAGRQRGNFTGCNATRNLGQTKAVPAFP